MVTIMDYPLLPYVYHKLNDFRIAPVESEWPIAYAGACGRVRTLYAHTRARTRTCAHVCCKFCWPRWFTWNTVLSVDCEY